MKSYRQFKTKLLKDKQVRKTYEELNPEFAFVRMLIQKRTEKGFTQRELAEKMGTKQSAISRFESGTYNPSISFLKKIAEALGAKIRISLA